MKNIISIFIILFVSLTIFTGCSSNTIIQNPTDLNNNEDGIVAEEISEKNEVAQDETKLVPPALPED